MYISSQKAQVLSGLFKTLAESHSERSVRERVGHQMLHLLDADYYASYVWDEERQLYSDRVAINMGERNLATYEAYFQFRDPITPSLQQRRKPTCVEEVMPQHELVRTEFFNDFLYRDGLYWGVNLYAWAGDRNIGDMRIWRSSKRDRFDDQALELLTLIQPAFIGALSRARGAAKQISVPAEGAGVRVEVALSDRERDVAELAGLGFGDKEIARRLGISFATVRTHLGNAFRKLGVDNRVQLVNRLAQARRGMALAS